MKIIFYNRHQNGDKALSRGIVSYIASHVPEEIEMFYWCSKDPAAIFVHDRVTCIGLEEGPAPAVNYQIIDDIMFIDTWIGACPEFLNPNRPNYIIGSNLYPLGYSAEFSFIHCKNIIQELNSQLNLNIPYPKHPVYIIPKTNNNPPQKKKVDMFLDELKSFKKIILLSNGYTYSGQCDNFKLSDYVRFLVASKPDIAFVYTAKDIANPLKNEFFIDDICTLPNLNEIEYFSQFCDILVSRQSGPGIMVQTFENLHDTSKTLISITVYPEFSSYYYRGGTCKYDMTNDHSPEAIRNIILKHLDN